MFIEAGRLSTATIRLNKGYTATVDVRDLALVSSHRWRVMLYKNSPLRYAITGSHGTHVFMHRLIAQTPPGYLTDHRNHDGLDNRRENLRVVTHTENMQNRRGAARHSRTGVRGVYKKRSSHNGGWHYRVQVRANGQCHGAMYPYTPEGLLAAEQRAIEIRRSVHVT